MDTSLFARGPSPTLRFFVLACISVALMVYDQRTDKLENFRLWVGTLLHPIQIIVDLPAKATSAISQSWASKEILLEENLHLKEQNKILAARLHEFNAVRSENDQLRQLLETPARAENQFSSARILAIQLSENQQKILLNKGINDGVVDGMAIVDDGGLMGQITRVYPFHSEGMLISDPSHAVPIQVVRNGIRDALRGKGHSSTLQMLHPSINADIQQGDLLVTSGLGGRFPADYPVAKVTSVERPDSSSFAKIMAEPLANLERSKNVLLLHSIPRSLDQPQETTPIVEQQ